MADWKSDCSKFCGTRRTMIAGALLLGAAHANAQDRWRYAGNSAEFDLYVDTTTIDRTGSMAEAWAEYRYTGQNTLSRSAVRFRFDCKRRLTTQLSSTDYLKSGKVKTSNDSPYASPSPVIPDTIGELTWAAVCTEEAQELGLRQVQQLGERLRRTDPDFGAKLEGLSSQVQIIQSSYPPTLWAEAIEAAYRKLPSQGSK